MRSCNDPSRQCILHFTLATKGLRKAEYSDFCIFAKFRTCFLPYVYSVYRILCHNQKFGITQKIDIWNKMINLIFRPKMGFWVKDSLFCIYRIYHVKIEFLFFAKNSFLLKFRLEYSSSSSVCRALLATASAVQYRQKWADFFRLSITPDRSAQNVLIPLQNKKHVRRIEVKHHP